MVRIPKLSGPFGSGLVLLLLLLAACSQRDGGGGGGDAGPDAEPRGDGSDFTPDDDVDDDGFTVEEGDCNDFDANANPGAYDTLGNEVDEDCNGTPDDTVVGCDDGDFAIDDDDAGHAAASLGLCKAASERSWGLLEAKYVKADGTTGMAPISHGLMAAFGDHFVPLEGERMVALSSGTARGPGDPGWIRHGNDSYLGIGGYNVGTSSDPPPGFPVAGCGGSVGDDTTAYDPAALEIKVRVPTNARSVSFRFNFFTAEYSSYVCDEYNDFFVALQSPVPDGALAGNVSFDAMGAPISVNNGFLSICEPGTYGGKTFTCPSGVDLLDGTGFDERLWIPDVGEDPVPIAANGATGWLETTTPVTPGSVVIFRFAVWDAGDGLRDALVLIDDFKFLADDADDPVTYIVL